MKIGQNIRRIRREKGMTQWQLSNAVGVTSGKIILIERGSVVCSADLLRKIATTLEVPEQALKQ